MTFQATIYYDETVSLITNSGNAQFTSSQHLILQLDAPSLVSAHQVTQNRWQKMKLQLPQMSAPRLLGLKEATPRCPRCGASEMSFCHH